VDHLFKAVHLRNDKHHPFKTLKTLQTGTTFQNTMATPNDKIPIGMMQNYMTMTRDGFKFKTGQDTKLKNKKNSEFFDEFLKAENDKLREKV